jgi:hypothetical protein
MHCSKRRLDKHDDLIVTMTYSLAAPCEPPVPPRTFVKQQVGIRSRCRGIRPFRGDLLQVIDPAKGPRHAKPLSLQMLCLLGIATTAHNRATPALAWSAIPRFEIDYHGRRFNGRDTCKKCSHPTLVLGRHMPIGVWLYGAMCSSYYRHDGGLEIGGNLCAMHRGSYSKIHDERFQEFWVILE